MKSSNAQKLQWKEIRVTISAVENSLGISVKKKKILFMEPQKVTVDILMQSLWHPRSLTQARVGRP